MREPYRLTYALGDMRGRANLSGQQLEVLLRALVAVNRIRLQASGSRLQRDLAEVCSLKPSPFPTGWRPPGQEEWQDAATMVLKGTGSNTDIVCAKAAALQLEGKQVRAVPVLQGGAWRAALWSPQDRHPVIPSSLSPGWKPLSDRMRFTFVLDVFNGQKQPDSLTAPTLEALLDGLTEIDVNFLQAHPETLTIDELAALGRLLYMEEPIGQEDWQDVPTCIRMGILDCEDGACWDAAQDIVRGEPSRAVASKHESAGGGTLYHITKKTLGARPRTRDISRVLGMR